MKKRLKLGIVVVTPQAMCRLHPFDVLRAIFRHRSCNWDGVAIHERTRHLIAVRTGDWVETVHLGRSGARFVITTLPDRSQTLVLMDDER